MYHRSRVHQVSKLSCFARRKRERSSARIATLRLPPRPCFPTSSFPAPTPPMRRFNHMRGTVLSMHWYEEQGERGEAGNVRRNPVPPLASSFHSSLRSAETFQCLFPLAEPYVLPIPAYWPRKESEEGLRLQQTGCKSDFNRTNPTDCVLTLRHSTTSRFMMNPSPQTTFEARWPHRQSPVTQSKTKILIDT